MRIRAVVPMLVAFVVAGLAVAQVRPGTISVSEIRPGMRGYGLTVFHGTQPERFDVEVIDVLENFRPDLDLILIRTPHPILNTANAVGGMSGSPIYLDGDRLAGAYAYGWGFGKEPVAGVTPIAKMFEDAARPIRPDAFPGANVLRPFVARGSASVATRSDDRVAFTPTSRRSTAQLGDLEVVRLSTPLSVSGFGDRALSTLEPLLDRFGLVPLQAGGGARSARGRSGPVAAAPPFAPGGAIGVTLMRGDMTMTGTGTVTYTSGSRVLAFGHPMLNAGEIGLPTTTARIAHILASHSRSFKLSAAERAVGTLINDRPHSIVVDTGVTASVVPVRIRINDGTVPSGASPRSEWNVEVANHKALTRGLTLAALANAIETRASDVRDMSVRVSSRVEIQGHTPLQLTDHVFVRTGVLEGGALDSVRAFDVMRLALDNDFEAARLIRVELDVTLGFDDRAAAIVDASITNEIVNPGEEINVRVRLRRLNAGERVMTVPVRIPDRAAGKEIEIAIQSGESVVEDYPDPQSLDDQLARVRDRHHARELVVSLKMPTRGIRFSGFVARELPGGAVDALQVATGTQGGEPVHSYVRTAVDVPEILSGGARVRVTVREVAR